MEEARSVDEQASLQTVNNAFALNAETVGPLNFPGYKST